MFSQSNGNHVSQQQPANNHPHLVNGGGNVNHLQNMSITKNFCDSKKYEEYLKAREKAYNIGNELEDAQKEHVKNMMAMIRNMQKQFYMKYGKKIEELEDIEYAIGHVQSVGIKNLKRQVQALYLESLESNDQEDFKQKSKLLKEEFNKCFYPKDNYQKKRDEEAIKLQHAIMGNFGGGSDRPNIVFLNGNKHGSTEDSDDGDDEDEY